MKKLATGLLTILVIALLSAGAHYLWQQRTQQIDATAGVAPTVVASGRVDSASAPAPTEPAIKYPIEGINTTAALPALAEANAYVREALTRLLGQKDVSSFLQIDGFVRRVVATVDNLPREHAPISVWPVTPMPGRFTTWGGDDKNPAGEATVNPDNGLRYSPFVFFIESIDTAKAVTLYTSLYPLFQQAYVELGYPKGYFNDRLVAAIDHLLAVPVQTGPISVNRPDVKGAFQPVRPWVTYKFTDPALDALSAGQKMLIRSGPVNHRRLQSKLVEIRRQITGGALARPINAAR